ncbi:Phosphoserine aminotransferase [Posidoniimonas polymericola]|uniref:Phosphoserine aminotransferase n=1 Tax=Posidoniimonas polymericola TaxID=2528002 RepID=A0A5C5YSX1_9BACT|nr:3-phosphoserine/phosphohydroxythreonine transaminase [Posidoniimonas polymericola]TWT77901.1 Phosphoserine aminotransferase [Posidoniimonas polymericola]
MDERVFNFSAGPAVLPVPVLEQIRDEMLCLPGAGASIMEISHRGGPFTEIIHSAEANLRKLLDISDDYAVLFLQGGSRLQFSMVPINLLGEGQSADYILTGSWGKKAMEEAQKEGQTRVAYTAKGSGFDHVPEQGDLDLDPQAAYCHYTCNETIEGVQFNGEPDTGGVPLVCDASSDFLHRKLDISRYGMVYACAQKNAGPSGVTIVIMRKDLAERSDANLPSYLSYANHIKEESLGNTPPTFAIYVVDLVTKWLLNDIGGLDKMFEQNKTKALKLYDVIDAHSDLYKGHAQPSSRSVMNVTFNLPSDELTSKFLGEAKKHKLEALKGHRSVGGIRASIYNAMPVEGVDALASFMKEFAKNA